MKGTWTVHTGVRLAVGLVHGREEALSQTEPEQVGKMARVQRGTLERKLVNGCAGCYLDRRTHGTSESMDQHVETRAVDRPWTHEAWNHNGQCAGERLHRPAVGSYAAEPEPSNTYCRIKGLRDAREGNRSWAACVTSPTDNTRGGSGLIVALFPHPWEAWQRRSSAPGCFCLPSPVGTPAQSPSH